MHGLIVTLNDRLRASIVHRSSPCRKAHVGVETWRAKRPSSHEVVFSVDTRKHRFDLSLFFGRLSSSIIFLPYFFIYRNLEKSPIFPGLSAVFLHTPSHSTLPTITTKHLRNFKRPRGPATGAPPPPVIAYHLRKQTRRHNSSFPPTYILASMSVCATTTDPHNELAGSALFLVGGLVGRFWGRGGWIALM